MSSSVKPFNTALSPLTRRLAFTSENALKTFSGRALRAHRPLAGFKGCAPGKGKGGKGEGEEGMMDIPIFATWLCPCFPVATVIGYQQHGPLTDVYSIVT